MGCYHTFEDKEKQCQLKVGNCDKFMDYYQPGDQVDPAIQDGLYLEYGGIVIIRNHRFIGIFDNLQDKWGNKVDFRKVLDENNPIYQVIGETKAKLGVK